MSVSHLFFSFFLNVYFVDFVVVLQPSDLPRGFDIPIFTEEFLDQNKGNGDAENRK